MNMFKLALAASGAACYLLAAILLTVERRRTRFAIGPASCMRKGVPFYAAGVAIAAGLFLTAATLALQGADL